EEPADELARSGARHRFPDERHSREAGRKPAKERLSLTPDAGVPPVLALGALGGGEVLLVGGAGLVALAGPKRCDERVEAAPLRGHVGHEPREPAGDGLAAAARDVPLEDRAPPDGVARALRRRDEPVEDALERREPPVESEVAEREGALAEALPVLDRALE